MSLIRSDTLHPVAAQIRDPVGQHRIIAKQLLRRTRYATIPGAPVSGLSMSLVVAFDRFAAVDVRHDDVPSFLRFVYGSSPSTTVCRGISREHGVRADTPSGRNVGAACIPDTVPASVPSDATSPTAQTADTPRTADTSLGPSAPTTKNNAASPPPRTSMHAAAAS